MAYFTNRAGGQIRTGPPALAQYFSPVSNDGSSPQILYGTNGFTNTAGTIAATSNTGVLVDSLYSASTQQILNYLNMGTIGAINYNSSNLFCEFWVQSTFFSQIGGVAPLFSIYSPDLSTTKYIEFGVYSPASPPATRYLSLFTNGSLLNGGTNIYLTSPKWYHLAFSIVNNSTLYLYVNGVIAYSGAVTFSTYSPSAVVCIGYAPNLNDTIAFIQDMRLITGGLPTTTNFTPTVGPWPSGSVPSYVPGGTNVFGLAAKYLSRVSLNNH